MCYWTGAGKGAITASLGQGLLCVHWVKTWIWLVTDLLDACLGLHEIDFILILDFRTLFREVGNKLYHHAISDRKGMVARLKSWKNPTEAVSVFGGQRRSVDDILA